MGIQVVGLAKRFGPIRAIDSLDLEVPSGCFQVLYGPNGAGKTTLLKILAGVAKPSAGQVRLDDVDLLRHPQRLRGRIGFLTHTPYLYADLSAEENLRFYADLYGLHDPAGRAREVLEEVGLAHRRHDRVGTFSRGMTQRVSIARALIHRPDVLLLDEPFSGLDPEAADHLHGLLGGLRDGRRSMILTTHDIARGLALADRLAILARGRIAWSAERGTLTAVEVGERYHQVVARAVEALAPPAAA